jgi:hypothetical protein
MELSVKKLFVKALFIKPSALGLAPSTRINYFQFSSEEIGMQTFTGFDSPGASEKFYDLNDLDEQGKIYFCCLCNEFGHDELKEEFAVDLDLIESATAHDRAESLSIACKIASEKMQNCELDDEVRKFWAYIHFGLQHVRV